MITTFRAKLGHSDALAALLGGVGMQRTLLDRGDKVDSDGERVGCASGSAGNTTEARAALDPLAALRSTRELHALGEGLLSVPLRPSLEWRDSEGVFLFTVTF